MRLLRPIATTFLLLTCVACGGDSAPPTVDPAKQAELERLGNVAEAFALMTIQLSEIGKGQGVAGPEIIGRTVEYTVTLTNPTEHVHLVVYSVYWDAGRFLPTDTGVCSDWRGKFPIGWPDEPSRSEVLQPFASVVKPNESSRLPDCFEIDPASGSRDIYEIDGWYSWELEYRVAELEGREIEY